MENDTFDKLSKEFGIENTSSETEIEKFEQKKKELVEKSNSINTFEDKVYLQEEIKSLVEGGKLALNLLAQDLKIGTPARNYEVYASLFDSVINGLKELRELNRNIAELQIQQVKHNPASSNDNVKVNIQLTGKELMDLFKTAKEESQLNKIDATFQVEEIDERNPPTNK